MSTYVATERCTWDFSASHGGDRVLANHSEGPGRFFSPSAIFSVPIHGSKGMPGTLYIGIPFFGFGPRKKRLTLDLRGVGSGDDDVLPVRRHANLLRGRGEVKVLEKLYSLAVVDVLRQGPPLLLGEPLRQSFTFRRRRWRRSKGRRRWGIRGWGGWMEWVGRMVSPKAIYRWLDCSW